MTRPVLSCRVRRIPIAAGLAAALAGSFSAPALAEPMIPPAYPMVWSDEFDRDGAPDPAKWVADIERNRLGWWNNERQYYSANRLDNARVEHGNLIIEARRDGPSLAALPDWGRQAYSSARLMTRGRGEWTYGAYEIRAKLPCARGSWPGIWMLPADPKVVWPNGGEIDIMEHVGADLGKIHFSTHTQAQNFVNHTENTAQATVGDACTAFHRYQLRWTPKQIVMGVDDRRVFSLKKAADRRDLWPFDRPFYLLLNIAVGGDWGGIKGIDDVAFPTRMEVDYVHVFGTGAAKP